MPTITRYIRREWSRFPMTALEATAEQFEKARSEARQDQVEVITFPDAYGRKTTVTTIYLGGEAGIESREIEVDYEL